MDDARSLLMHQLAAIAYRLQKALRDAPEGFAAYRVIPGVRTPMELVRHMASVLGYAGTLFRGGTYHAEALPTFAEEIARLHSNLEFLREHFESDPFAQVTPKQLLQGPLADAMTHVGQLAMLRRMFGSPVPPENFVYADVKAGNLGPHQPDPVAPDAEWNVPEHDLPG